MDKLKCLYELAQREKIEVYSYNLPENIAGLIVCNNDIKGIAINKNIRSPKEEKCILAEELGHYFTSAGDLRLHKTRDYSKAIEISRQERRARKWAVERLIRIQDFIEAFKAGCQNKYEVAEFLDVTEAFLDEAIRIYNEKYGKYKIVDDTWIVYFDPFGVARMDF